ncbi:class I SAM-dependent methyltransferase [Chromobacterium violaceum]|uniref:Probable methyl transferase n=1 Tax=Chromobacterium violaceum (strain ATCC 12472 / DSM 30191 / JCM 1249 / CCUG 213 / NBRC 12614 / NCIMB 9131 / NCTC 9757 / MK) TaxID=243365 RepID=Q7P1P3_CHRVO|nr:class I SAM-dependent methyltransferase [Chromobacterium violaceum]AAQ57849.2 probable methyl transferase [Chromobacterium violaceum ATCC 12472]MCD0492847.1 class I SAM-dependent methyltransferase [Chromobacterium violaceum]OQS10406.1 SAM-dependent methyltransferase [Chromobacterium violaceum]OQS29909.1 SAM-dependent methyltransferase [Chromobacterium violaceum]QIY79391.1 class I SAM-dependent methyltransferase [Chromobacterium violaceum]
MTQNIYDTPEFFHGYSQLNRSVHGLAGAPEWPSLQALLPELAGRAVADLGCGYGWFCRWAREAGARSALGLDVSEKMLARAAAMTADDAIEYRRQDLETLQLPPAAFDLVYSSLTLHYIEDLAGLLATCHRALKPGGRLVFSIEHPIFMAATQPQWLQDAQGQRCWPVSGYQDEGPRVTHWLADGVIKRHRTIGTLLNLVMAAGFTLRHVEDWGPSAEQVAAMPELAEERERPMLLLVAAQR